VNDWLAEGILNEKGDGVIRALEGEMSTGGESEGGKGRLVTLNTPIAMEVLENRIKKHLKLSQSQFLIFLSSLRYSRFRYIIIIFDFNLTLNSSSGICLSSN
jgi:hypothetical protein